MSYNQRRWEPTVPATAPCQYEYWWRERQRRTSDRQRGRLPVRPAFIPISTLPAAVFDPDQFRLVSSPQRITDLEKGLQHSHSQYSLRSDTTTIATLSGNEEKARPDQYTLPPERHSVLVRRLRYTIFAVYQRLFTFVVLVNACFVLVFLHSRDWQASRVFKTSTLATFASSNFLLAIFFRQDWFINLLFRSAWLVPWSLPLRVRRIISRVYCYGGIHSGAAVMGTVWWVVFAAVMSWEGVTRGTYTPLILVLTLVICSFLLTIILLSLPRLRARHHDTWEVTHRFMGWLSIALFWAQILLLTHYTTSTSQSPSSSFSQTLLHTPTFYTLSLITLLLIYPWLLLRRWTFTATPLSSHALQLSFPNKVHKYSCLALSTHPLTEWHPFATFPTDDPQNGTSIVVSAAGDWTRALIASATAQSTNNTTTTTTTTNDNTANNTTTHTPLQMQFYIKSHPHAGVLSLSCLYKRILILTTGSGIGPSLSSLLDRPATQHARLVWAARAPETTFGEEIMRLVARADPDAVIVDTSENERGLEGKKKRPDLLSLTHQLSLQERVEAVFVLSNEKVTRWVVGGLEERGVPAFGPIWDS